MKPVYRPLILAAAVFLLVLALLFVRGWTWAKYDAHDPNIGKEFILVGPMVYLSNLPKSYAGNEIANEYRSLINTKFRWDEAKSQFPSVGEESISCADKFTIVDVLYLIPIGLIEMSTNNTLKYFVVESEKHPGTVIKDSDYEQYARPVDYTGDDKDCISPSARDQ